MSKADEMKEKYLNASLRQIDPDVLRADATLGIGFLLGSNMYGAASALSKLFQSKFGADALPDMVRWLEDLD